MGITNFQKYIKKTYPKACAKKWENVSYDNLYIDLNCVLHHVCYLSKNTTELLGRTCDYIKNIIATVRPKKRLILVADGPAPLAKMILQRKRRLDSIKLLDSINPEEHLSLNLTPGTKFMMGLENAFAGFVKYIKSTYKIEVQQLITDSDEGEIKIKYCLQKIQNKNALDNHIVYSGDSDMILLLFTCNDLSKIYQMVSKDMTLSFGKMYDTHVEKFGGTSFTKYDFVFMNLLMGNDYLPKVLYLKLEHLWEAYGKLSKSYPDGLITYNCYDIKVDPMFFHDLLYIASKKIQPHFLKRFDITKDLRNMSYGNYAEGLYWCFGMYITGNCSNYKYIYDHNTSPHITGVMLTIMSINSYKITKSPSIDVDLYGILLIPHKARVLLSKEQNIVAEKIAEKYPVIYEEEKCVKCRFFSKRLSDLNKEYKKIDRKNGDDAVLENAKNMCKEIAKNGNNFMQHKKHHEKLNFNKIDEISKYFIDCRDDLRETMTLESDVEDNEIEAVIIPYKPRNMNIPHKKLF
jgi:hypothetical protein